MATTDPQSPALAPDGSGQQRLNGAISAEGAPLPARAPAAPAATGLPSGCYNDDRGILIHAPALVRWWEERGEGSLTVTFLGAGEPFAGFQARAAHRGRCMDGLWLQSVSHQHPISEPRLRRGRVMAEAEAIARLLGLAGARVVWTLPTKGVQSLAGQVPLVLPHAVETDPVAAPAASGGGTIRLSERGRLLAELRTIYEQLKPPAAWVDSLKGFTTMEIPELEQVVREWRQDLDTRRRKEDALVAWRGEKAERQTRLGAFSEKRGLYGRAFGEWPLVILNAAYEQFVPPPPQGEQPPADEL